MAEIVLDEQEKEIIRAFEIKIELTEATIKKKNPNISLLMNLEKKKVLEKILPVGTAKAIKWRLTDIGQKLLGELKAGTPKGAPKKKPAAKKGEVGAAKKGEVGAAKKGEVGAAKSSGLTPMVEVIQAITNYCAPHFERYNKMFEEVFDKLNNMYSRLDIKKPAVDLVAFQKMVQEIYENLNMKNNYGDVVPIPMLKQALRVKAGGQLQAEDINEMLLRLEEKRVIDLQIASDPSKVPNSQEGIQHPQRGVIYYVIWRHKG